MSPSRVDYFKVNLVRIVLLASLAKASSLFSANNDHGNSTTLATKLDRNISININNNEPKDLSNYFTVDCDYHSIDSNYFQRNNSTFWLATGSNLTYRCKLIIDARNCASTRLINHRTNTTAPIANFIPANCHDVQIVLQMPKSVDSNSELVQEDVRKVSYYSGYDKYVAWLNITNFTLLHQGLYQFDIYTLPGYQQIYHHAFILLKTNSTKFGLKSNVLRKNKCNSKSTANIARPECKHIARRPTQSWHLMLAAFALVLLLLVLAGLGYIWYKFGKNSHQLVFVNN